MINFNYILPNMKHLTKEVVGDEITIKKRIIDQKMNHNSKQILKTVNHKIAFLRMNQLNNMKMN